MMDARLDLAAFDKFSGPSIADGRNFQWGVANDPAGNVVPDNFEWFESDTCHPTTRGTFEMLSMPQAVHP